MNYTFSVYILLQYLGPLRNIKRIIFQHQPLRRVNNAATMSQTAGYKPKSTKRTLNQYIVVVPWLDVLSISLE